MSFGERLASLRHERGLSQYELADRLGFSRGQIGNYEQGKREADYETLTKISDFFDVTTDYLLGNTDQRDVKKDPDGYWFRLDTKGVSDEKRKRMIEEIESVSEWIAKKYSSDKE